MKSKADWENKTDAIAETNLVKRSQYFKKNIGENQNGEVENPARRRIRN